MNLIIVDDIEENRYLLETLLAANGYEVRSAGNGAEALQMAKKNPPDLIISDILMPVMDGYSLCHEWQQDVALKKIPFVFYSATYTDPKDVAFALNLGASRFLVKPAESDVFLRMVQEVLNQQDADRLPAKKAHLPEEEAFLKEYNQTLIRKLEKKMADLQDTNRRLEQEIILRQAREEEGRRLIAAVENTDGIVMITNAHGVLQYVNPAFERITGFSRAEAIGQTPRILKSFKHDEAFYTAMWAELTRGRTWRGRLINRTKNGSFFTCECTISPIRAEDGRIVSYTAIASDITAALAREELIRQNQKMESLGRLVSGVAHDFNNVLQSVKGFDTLLKQAIERARDGAPLDLETMAMDVEEIRKASDLAQSLIQQLLSFSHKHDRKYERLNLNSTLSANEQMLRKALHAGISLEFRLEADLHRVVADASQLLQIVLNLIVNARDAIDGKGRIEVATENRTLKPDDFPELQRAQDETFVCLRVSDNGCGMEPEQVAHLFEPFYTTKEQGTGIGLSVVYEIVQELGGAIEVASTPGKGSEFRIAFPLCHPELSALVK